MSEVFNFCIQASCKAYANCMEKSKAGSNLCVQIFITKLFYGQNIENVGISIINKINI